MLLGTLWILAPPIQRGDFAKPGQRGAWEVGPDGGEHRVRPLIIEWQPGSDLVGDFSWAAFEVIVTVSAGQRLAERFAEFELSPVKMIEGESASGGSPSVSFPYKGPPVREFSVTASVPFDPTRSTFDARGTPVGVERHELLTVDRGTGKANWRRVARVPGHGVFVRGRDIEGLDIFKVRGISWNFCTGRVRDFILESGFTNVDFLEVGEII
jgi:hypothetical protein